MNDYNLNTFNEDNIIITQPTPPYLNTMLKILGILILLIGIIFLFIITGLVVSGIINFYPMVKDSINNITTDVHQITTDINNITTDVYRITTDINNITAIINKLTNNGNTNIIKYFIQIANNLNKIIQKINK